ncbi:MAG: GyrI-like domain-containing protein [Anaerolineaceae bacterium]|nr:GyrI-like domain-containing protein [Anaerolineaceae bacterium]
MSYQCEIKENPEKNILAIRTRTAAQNLPQFFGQAYGQVAQYLEELQQAPVDAPFAIYYNMDMQDLDLAAGFVMAAAQPGKGEIYSDSIPAGKFAEVNHTGPYDSIEPAYIALTAFIKEKGFEPTGIAYEYYLNDPGTTKPEELLTRIVFGLKA